jgi:hypothetical protein
MSRSIATIAAFAGLGVLALAQDAPSRAFDLLKRVVDGSNQVDYSGKRVIEFKVGPDMKAHTELVLRSQGRTRIDFPQGSSLAGQVIVEVPGRREHYFPDSNEIRILPPRRQDAVDRLRFLVTEKSRFKFDVANGGRVAGRNTQMVTVSDNKGNKIQELWIDEQKPLVLKRTMFDPVGTLVGQFEFLTIDFNPRIPRDAFRIRRRGATYVTAEQHAERLAREKGFAPALLRDGQAKLEFAEMRHFMGKDVFVQVYDYDGKRLTLFQVEDELDTARIGRMGRNVKVHSWTSSGRSFALLGELAKSKLEELARKVSERRSES